MTAFLFWYLSTWLVATFAHPAFFQALPQERRAQIRIGLAAVCSVVVGLAVTGWSFRADLLDPLAPGALLLLGVLLLHSLWRKMRWSITAVRDTVLYSLWTILLAFVWMAAGFAASFTYPVVAEAHSQDGYNAKVRVRGAAWTSDRIVTTVAWTPAWIPLLEREMVSWAEKPKWDFANSREIRVEHVSGERAFAVFHEDEALDRVYY